MRVTVFVLFLLLLCFSCRLLFAAAVDIPNGFLYEKLGSNNLTVTAESDYVNKFELKKLDGEVTATVEDVKIAYSVAGSWIDVYMKAGQLTNATYDVQAGNMLELEFDDQFIWGVGANAVWNSDEFKEILFGANIFFDAKIMRAEDIGYNSASVNGVVHDSSSFSNMTDAKWTEQQLSVGLVKKLKYVVIYGGTKYTSARMSAKLTIAGTPYDLSEKNKEGKKFGGFIGVLVPFQMVHVGIEGRFVDEKAVNIKVGINF